MKQKLLFFFLTVLFSTVTMLAQTKTWDFGKDTSTWPTSAGLSVPTLIDNLALFPGSEVDNFGQVDNNSATWFGGTTDEYKSTQRLKFNGSGSIDPATDGKYIPTQRFLKFNVTGACTIKIWFRLSGTGDRDLYITDGTATVMKFVGSGQTTDPKFVTADYSGNGADLYMFGAKNSFNIYKIEVSPASALGTTTLGVKQFEKTTAVNVYAASSKVYVNNVKSNTKVEIYSTTGGLVKTINTATDTEVQVKSGVYIAKIKAEDGQKVVKLIVQ